VKWPWNRPLPAPPPAYDSALEARVVALEQRLAHIVADAGLLRVEWSEILDKISHWASRQAARDSKAARRNIDAAAQEPAGDTIADGSVPQSHPQTKAALRALVRSHGRMNGG